MRCACGLPRHAARTVVVHDGQWAGALRTALAVAVGELAAALALDAAAGTLTPARAALWTALAVALFAVVCPARTSCAHGVLTVRGPGRGRRVRLDRLVRVRIDGVVERTLTLVDADGRSARLDPAVLVANPLLWHEIDHGARLARAAGLLTDGDPRTREALRWLGGEIDDRIARELLEAGGLR
ncbi:hypothetical protein [Streptomyces sp. ICBB 8177]|uniref:hypothetical protein n=1 Tax=Streptomyces sp. ICBB 8177 TaxID=563922 RepID=UPI001F546B43|nr:hypothetical protein [Streptomyces sp. ICBB 8177]